jgi:hypothetical protein
MPAIAKAPIIAAWRAIIARHPTVFTFAAVNYTGFLAMIDGTLDLGLGGFTQGNGTQLFCLRADFLAAVPAEEDIVTIAGTDYRIKEAKKVFITAADVWGLVFALKGPSEP